MSDNLLQVDHLRASFFTHVGEVQAVRDVSFSLKKGEILGLVGESGSGKSVTCMSVMKLLSHPGRITGGAVSYTHLNCWWRAPKRVAGRLACERTKPLFSLQNLSTADIL